MLARCWNFIYFIPYFKNSFNFATVFDIYYASTSTSTIWEGGGADEPAQSARLQSAEQAAFKLRAGHIVFT